MTSECTVLLAEDSQANQEVERAMLEILGCRVEVASNGLEAIRLFQPGKFDIILMDCQMPVMDGWEATGKIREAEKESPVRVPIIAMTAYIQDEELEKCRTCGMDDHLGKPFGINDLKEKVIRWRPSAAPSEPVAANSPAQDTKTGVSGEPVPCIDPAALNNLRSSLGPAAPGVIRTVIKMYLEDAPLLIEDMNRGLETNEFELAERAAHTLKSSSANLGAMHLSKLSRKVEELARSRTVNGLEEVIRNVQSEYRTVKVALESELNQGAKSG